MKPLNSIALMFFVLLVACTPSTKTPDPADNDALQASTTLAAIDSLMWRQPDSALAQLQAFCNSPEADSLDEFNGHYCQLLISELLYKNDWGQSNREELLQAVAYFDSLVRLTPPLQRGLGGLKNTPSNQTPNFVFLDARAHYINGVGYYEKDSVVNACAEYLKTLEVMEEHFEEKELVGHKARFLAYTYNRLGDLFSEQFMMESAIECGEKALMFCRIEPTSSEGVSNILYRLGKQYDKMHEIDKARQYYELALENISNTDNMVYRDIVSSKALCDYELGSDVKQALDKLNYTLIHAKTENERLYRYLTIGGIYFLEGNYDSALFYLEPVFDDNEVGLQAQAAGYLRIIYDSIGNKEQSDAYMRFLTNNKKPDGENKALVSKLEAMFKNYQDQKQERQVEIERENAMKIVGGIIISIAIVALGVIIVVKWRSKTLLKKKQEEADRKLGETERQHREELEAERQTHRMEQAALSGRLKRSNEELRDISKRLELSLSKNAQYELGVSNDYAAFINDPICKHIVGVAHKQQFKSKTDYLIYKDNALSKEQLLDLRNAVQKHLPRFVSHIRRQYPKLTDNDMDCCCLVLLGLNEADISAMMQRAYTTVCDRSRKISRIIWTNDSLYHTLRNMLDE